MKLKDILGNWIFRNVALAVVLIFVFVVVVNCSLSMCTRHGQEIPVPDFYGKSLNEALVDADSAGISVVVTDSVYVRGLAPGAIYMQTPKAGSHVKKGRTIRLTANTMAPSEVYMPSLVGCSLRQAKAELQRSGLVLGRLIYVSDIATNYVLKQQRNGADVKPFMPLPSGTTIDLVLGLSSDDQTVIPNLIGRQYLNAVDMIHDNSLNVGRVRFDRSIKNHADSIAAVVASQYPKHGHESVLKGSSVDIFLTADKAEPSKE